MKRSAAQGDQPADPRRGAADGGALENLHCRAALLGAWNDSAFGNA